MVRISSGYLLKGSFEMDFRSRSQKRKCLRKGEVPETHNGSRFSHGVKFKYCGDGFSETDGYALLRKRIYVLAQMDTGQ